MGVMGYAEIDAEGLLAKDEQVAAEFDARRRAARHEVRDLLRAPAAAARGARATSCSCSRTRSTQVELADRLGIDYAWEVEHHFLEEYSHSSAPEVFLAAASQRTQRIRLGHGIVLMPPGYNQPARVAERIATLDLVSRGRVDWGTGESASRAELEGYGVNPAERRAMWRETVEQVANMMVMEPYPGFKGQYFSMPARNVVPKPVQKPHPPLWVACSNRETIHLAAQLGIGALTFAFIDPDRGQAVGGRLLRDLQARVRAHRPRGEPEHRDGHRASPAIATPPRRSAAAPTASASSSSRSPITTSSASTRRGAPTSGTPS